MTKILTLPLLVGSLFLAACGASNPVVPSNGAAGASANAIKTVAISDIIPYKTGAPIAQNIQSECPLGEQLSEFIQSHGSRQNIDVARAGRVSQTAGGTVLVVEIVDAVSQGNAFIGHRKYASVAGTLYENGTKKAAFTGARISGGGAFGGYKGSCSVLGRTVNTIGKDIAGWLMNPVDGVHLGNNI